MQFDYLPNCYQDFPSAARGREEGVVEPGNVGVEGGGGVGGVKKLISI